VQDFLSAKNSGEKSPKMKRFKDDFWQICICGKLVHGVCNTPQTFAHFSLALRGPIGDNPARS